MTEKKKYETKDEYEKRMKWFRNASLGVFIHWGLYSLLGHGEWAQWRENIHPMGWQAKETITIERTIIKCAKLS